MQQSFLYADGCGVISHTRTVVRECFKGDEASQWKRPKFDPSPHQNPSTDIQYWQASLRHGPHPACKILQRSVQGCLFPRYVILPCFWGDQYVRFFGFFNKATAYTRKRIFTRNTSNDVVPGKEVPFGGPDYCILYLDHYISEKPPFRGPILT